MTSDAGAPDAARRDAGRFDAGPFDAGAFVPNPALADLPGNTAMDLGPTALPGPAGESFSADSVTGYSGLVLDMNHHQLLMFGGGHAGTFTDAIYAFSFETLSWAALYPPTPVADMVCANFNDTLGGWNAGPAGPYPRPAARHTYDLLAVPPGRREFLVFRTGDGGNGQVDTCNYYWGSDNRAPRYSFVTGTWDFPSIGFGGGFGNEAVEPDPVSGSIVAVGSAGLFVFDPASSAATQPVDGWGAADLGYANHLVYSEAGDAFYYFNRNGQTVWRLAFNRATPAQSTLTAVPYTGTYPDHGEPGYAYDRAHGIIGGAVFQGRFHVFDPGLQTFTSLAMGGPTPADLSYHALAYDPVNNVFVFVADDRHTWVYRFQP